MEIQGILKNLREKNNLTQEQLAERVQVTRQAVSRWETGETQPNTDTLKLLSRVFDVSINTLLGSPRQLVCQCCGMPLNEDGLISREPDGSYNEDYCKSQTSQNVQGQYGKVPTCLSSRLWSLPECALFPSFCNQTT